MRRPIRWITISRKEWLKELPKLVKTLSYNYGFYYNEHYNHILDIDDILAKNDKKKVKGRINVYVADTKLDKEPVWYMVIYTKHYIKVYKCLEYTRTESYANIKRFIKKFTDAYKAGKNERFDREIEESMQVRNEQN